MPGARALLAAGLLAVFCAPAHASGGHAPNVFGDVAFADARHGALVSDCYSGCGRLQVTDDGGHHLRRVAMSGRGPITVQAAGGRLYAARGGTIRALGVGPVAALPDPIVAWAVRDGGVWAWTQRCRKDGRRCRTRLWHGASGGGRLRARGVRAAEAGDFGLAAAAAGRVLALYPREDGNVGLLRTTDGGASWTSLRPPCDPLYRSAADLAASPDGALFLLCGTGRGTGDEGHEVFRSLDGGATFALRDRARVGHADPGGLGSFGYLDGVVPASSRVAYVPLTRKGLFRTGDGGRKWRVLRGFPLYDASEFWGLAALPDGHVWLSLGPIGFYASADAGRHWRRLARGAWSGMPGIRGR